MFKAFKTGIKIGFQQFRVAGIIYLLQFLLALPLALQIFRVLNASIGDSLEVERLIYEYDNTIFRDFLNHHGASITPLIGQIRWIIFIYFVLWIFLNGGILHSIKEGVSRWETFWTGCARYFFSFLKISLCVLVLHVVWAMVILIPLNAILGDVVNDLPTERDAVFIVAVAGLIYLIGFVILLVINLTSKIKVVHDRQVKVFPAIWAAFGWVRKHFFRGLGLFFLYFIVQGLFFAVYVLADKSSGMVTEALIFVFFFLQQFLIFSRILIRIMTAGAFWTLHANSLPNLNLLPEKIEPLALP